MQQLSLSIPKHSNAWIRAALLVALMQVALFGAAMPALADPATLHCVPNADRVWLYDSLVSFNVVAHLRCGDSVDVIGRTPGYVKVRNTAGQEGYVPQAALPDLPPPADAAQGTEAAPHPMTLAEAAAMARHHAAPPATQTVSTASAPVAVAAPVAVPAAAPAAAVVTKREPMPVPAAVPMATAAQPAPRPAAAPVSAAPAPQPEAEIVLTTAPDAPAPAATPAPAVKPVAAKPTPKPATPVRAKKPAPAVAPAAPAPQEVAEIVLTTAPDAPAPAPAPASAAISVSPVRDATPAAAPFNSAPAAAIVHTASVNEDEDEDAAADNAAARADHPDCSAYFSAYGLSPNQYKWIVTNRKKFPGICPAPTPSLVDFVMIFTHDVNFYNVTMPTPVRTINGLSDWTPMRTEDSALVPVSEMDKNHREYVWVFHTKRGAFDPARFSSKRHPLFEKSESNTFGTHAGDRTAEDALRFIAENRTTN